MPSLNNKDSLLPPTKVNKKQIFLASSILIAGIIIGYFINISRFQPNNKNPSSETSPQVTPGNTGKKEKAYTIAQGIKFQESDDLIISKGYLKGYDLSVYEDKSQKVSLEDCVKNRDKYRSLDIIIKLLENPDNLSLESFVDKEINESVQDIITGPFQKERIGDIDVMWQDTTSASTRILYLAKDDLVYLFFAYSYSFPDKETSQKQLTLLNLLIGNIEFIDQRDCLGERVNTKLTKETLVGKKFENFCMSGESGTFNPNGRLPVSWGLDYAGPNDTRPSSGIGKWEIIEGKLEVSGTAISDRIYDNLRFYEYKGDLFAIPKDSACSMFIGPSSEKIDDFYKNKFEKEVCKN